MIGGLSPIPSGGGIPAGKEGVQHSPRDVQPVLQEFYVHSEMEIGLIPPSYYERAPQKTSLLKEGGSSFIIGTDAHTHIHADARISPMSHINVIIAAGGSSLRYGKENKLLEPCEIGRAHV